MAKTKNTKKVPKKKEVKTNYKSQPVVEDDVITIEFQSLLTPISIIIGSIIISVAIIYGLKDGVSVDRNDSDEITQEQEVVADDSNNDVAQVDDENTDKNGFTYMTANIDDDAIEGDIKKAKVAIIEFSDYECPYCKQFGTDVYNQIVENYVDTGKVVIVFRDLPWLEAHPNSEIAANAANCAREQKGDAGYYDYHDALLESTLSGVDSLYEIADDLGLKASTFKTCVDSEKYMDEVFADRDYAHTIGINGTPGFVIGLLDDDGNVTGVNIGGLAAYSTYASVIDEYLEKAE